MNRKLNPQEKELTAKGLDRNQTELKLLKEALDMTMKHSEFTKLKRAYEDSVRPFNRANEDREMQKTIKGYQSEIQNKEETIKILKEQLTKGVEIKQASGTG